ncbi:hypothetical protein [Qipengyuania sp.]|uniref:hypothetical protein n=2 Tax=Qipengyuania sp. TaxID=2004515 RepID=UPI00351741C0
MNRESTHVIPQRPAYGMGKDFRQQSTSAGAVALSIRNWATVVALVALAFPTLLMSEIAGRVIFPHYIALAVIIPILTLTGQACWSTVKPIIPVLAMIFISTLINITSTNLLVAGFHSLHLVAIALLAGCSGVLALRFAKFTILAYVAAILLAQTSIVLGFASWVEWLLVVKDGASALRVSAFATEPSYAAMIILVLTRFVICFDIGWLSPPRFGLILAALLATLSLFALISAILLLAMYLNRRGDIRAMAIVVVGGSLLLFVSTSTDFFTGRLQALDFTRGAEGLGTGTVRLLPYIYMGQILPHNPLPLFFGAGAGALEAGFFHAMGRYATVADFLSVHMAGPIYDYGLLAVIPIIFLWNRPRGNIDHGLFVLMTIAIILNTGIGTYLFIIFGTFALLEQRVRAS